MSKSLKIPEDPEKGHLFTGPGNRTGWAIRLSSRVGVWGITAGLSGILTVPLLVNIHSSPWMAIAELAAGLGCLLGGFGVSVASGLVLREVRGLSRILSVGAMVGIPFGLSVAALGAFRLWGGLVVHPIQLASLVAAFGLGIGLVLLFLAGVVKELRQETDSGPEFI